jgi:hypothetical protein
MLPCRNCDTRAAYAAAYAAALDAAAAANLYAAVYAAAYGCAAAAYGVLSAASTCVVCKLLGADNYVLDSGYTARYRAYYSSGVSYGTGTV